MLARPLFATVRHNFWAIFGYGDVADVAEKIGGKVAENIKVGLEKGLGGFNNNPCALRLSYSLNHSGVTVTSGAWHTVTGGDGRQYIYRVGDLAKFLRQTFGPPDLAVKRPQESQFAGKRGILIFMVDFQDCRGHATLWDGGTCSDACYFGRAIEALFWQLN